MSFLNDKRQVADAVLMVRPARFAANPQTVASNAFQQARARTPGQAEALVEFDRMVAGLRDKNIRVIVADDTAEPHKPDAIFPNNWVSFHDDGTVILYPMEAPNRRLERRMDIIEELSEQHGFMVREILDLSPLEQSGRYLESTGSLVFDRACHVAYAALSTRTHIDALADFSQRTDYTVLAFDAVGTGSLPVYHTNVMMSIGEHWAVICAEAIVDAQKRKDILTHLRETGRTIVEISVAQMQAFAGNVLEIRSADGLSWLVLSARALAALDSEQTEALMTRSNLLSFDIDTIERLGGGSARCMIAEIFLPATSAWSEND